MIRIQGMHELLRGSQPEQMFIIGDDERAETRRARKGMVGVAP